MMSRQQLESDLRDIRIKKLCKDVWFLNAKIVTDIYIICQFIDDRNEDYACDNAISRKFVIQVDVFSKGDYSTLVKTIEEVLTEKEYRFVNGFDIWEDDTKLYHKVLRFNYKEFK